jgi:hypothetical protein
MRSAVSRLVVGLVVIAAAPGAAAKPLGSFDWQLQPFCNRVTLEVFRIGDIYALDGYDDQCGAARRLPVTGEATENPDGTLELGLHAVPVAGVPLHFTANVGPGLSGTWRDSQGRNGLFALGAAAAGPMRPIPTNVAPPSSIGATPINTTQVQRRVTGVCAGALRMSAVNGDGTVACLPAGTGDITAVAAGAGLIGGGVSGNVALAASFAGSGVATTVAHSDHTHGFATDNTSVGELALPATTTGFGNSASGRQALATNTTGSLNTASGVEALEFNTTGNDNTAVGAQALSSNTTATGNTATGASALDSNTTGGTNTANGRWALRLNTSGASNTAVGSSAMDVNTTGSSNTAVGQGALIANTTGTGNLALGAGAGNGLVSGSNNVYLRASAAAAAEANTMRLGSTVTRAFIAGVRGVATGAADAVTVMVDSNGQLGTISSSRRTKDDIAPLGDVSRDLFKLRPVRFTYKQPVTDGSRPVQFGLIAEEVAEVLPALVARGADGTIETVKYHVLPTLLLAEVQRLERENAAARDLREALEARVSALERLIESSNVATERVAPQRVR